MSSASAFSAGGRGSRWALASAAASLVGALVGGAAAQPAGARGPAVREKEACADSFAQAQRLRRDGKLIAARREALLCAQASCGRFVAVPCGQWAAELEALTPTLAVRARAPDGADALDVRVSADGAPLAAALDGRPLALDPGAHRLVFERDGSPPVVHELLLREGERGRLLDVAFVARPLRAAPRAAAPAAPRAARPVPASVYVWGGVALAGLAGAGALHGLARARHDELRDGCAPACGRGEVAGPRRLALAGDVALGAGLLSLGVATWALVTRPERPARAALRWGVTAGPGGAFVGAAARF